MANLTIKNGSAVAEIREIAITTSNGPVACYKGRVDKGEHISIPLKNGLYTVSVTPVSPKNLEGQNNAESREVRINDSDTVEVFSF